MAEEGLFEGSGNSRIEQLLNVSNQNMSKLIETLMDAFPAQSASASELGVLNSTSGGTTIKVGSGYIVALAVTTASTGATGMVYDANSPANVGSTNAMTLIPASGNIAYGMPFTNGLTVQPSSSGSQQVSVYYI